jgi:tetratricopeptide (TPR) repeat protein
MINESHNASYHFYLGISYIEVGRFEDAISTLEPIANKESEFSQQTLWYLGLLHLRINEEEKAKQYLKRLNEKGIYYINAQEILKKL